MEPELISFQGSRFHTADSVQKSSHDRDGKLEVCPPRKGTQQRENECEIEEKLELRHSRVIGLSDDPVREKQECRSEDHKVINSEMRG